MKLKKWAIALSAVVIASTLLVGCGDKTNQAGDAKKQVVAQEELTIQEVMTKANEASKKATGMVVDMKNKSKISMPNMTLETNMDFKQEVTLNPAAVHLTGSVKTLGKSINMELYFLDKDSYVKASGLPGIDGWNKAPADMSKKMFGLDQIAEQSMQSLEQFNNAYKIYEKDQDAFTLKKENGAYILTFDSSKVKDKTKLVDIYKSAMDKMMQGPQVNPSGKADIEKMMSNTKINDAKQVVTLDEKTFEVKKIDVTQNISMKVGQQELTAESNAIMDFKGAPTSPITIPEDVKKAAKEMKI